MTETPAAVSYERRPLADLLPFPGNPRTHDLGTLRASLRAHGQYRPLLVQASTGYVLAGNGTAEAMLAEGWTEADVAVIDVDDDHARKIVAVDNRAHDLGGYDERALADLLASIDDLDATGYEPDDLDDLLAKLEESTPTPESAGRYAEAGNTGVRPTPSYREYQDAYAERATRFFALIYPLGQYAWVEEKLTKLAAEFGYDNNSDTLLRLLADRIGEEAPPAE